MAQPRTRLTIFNDRDELAVHAADTIVRITADAIRLRGKAMLALCGGTTPQPTYALLAQSPRVNQIDWSRTFVFLSDERFVPADHAESNFGTLQRTLLAPAGSSHVFPVPTDLATARAAASAYETTLASTFGQPRDHPPCFDLVLLGLGKDGHVASLFPGAPALDERDRWVVAGPAGVLPPHVDRITMTFPVINAAREVVFLVSGEDKAAALHLVLEDRPRVEECPAAGVVPENGELYWFVDRAAARLLSQTQ